MANPDAPFGVRPVAHMGGGTPGRLSQSTYRLSTAYNTDLFENDVVKKDGAGNVVIAADGDAFIGTFAGVKWVGSDGSIHYSNHWVANTAEKSGTVIEAYVYDDPNLEFEVQSDGSMTRADIGQFCNIVTSVAGNATTGISGQQTGATGGSESQFLIVDVVMDRFVRNSTGNQAVLTTGANAVIRVKPAKHQNAGAALAVEV